MCADSEGVAGSTHPGCTAACRTRPQRTSWRLSSAWCWSAAPHGSTRLMSFSCIMPPARSRYVGGGGWRGAAAGRLHVPGVYLEAGAAGMRSSRSCWGLQGGHLLSGHSSIRWLLGLTGWTEHLQSAHKACRVDRRPAVGTAQQLLHGLSTCRVDEASSCQAWYAWQPLGARSIHAPTVGSTQFLEDVCALGLALLGSSLQQHSWKGRLAVCAHSVSPCVNVCLLRHVHTSMCLPTDTSSNLTIGS